MVSLVYDGGSQVNVPSVMGVPRDDQCAGEPASVLSEICGRVCYDSLGSGRSTIDYHPNVRKDQHLSIYEHPHFTVRFPLGNIAWALNFLNKPDLIVSIVDDEVRVTVNLRHVMEWDSYPNVWVGSKHHVAPTLAYDVLMYQARCLAPEVFQEHWEPSPMSLPWLAECSRVEPKYQNEKFVTLYFEASRVWSHEMVRHRHNISQRSSRYCDESETPYIIHPLLQRLLTERPGVLDRDTGDLLSKRIVDEERMDKTLYDTIAKGVQCMLMSDGVDPHTARKQARSSARYYLGNGLGTAMMYTASCWYWRRLLKMRLHPAADAEIRAVSAEALRLLQASRYGDEFEDMCIELTKTGPILSMQDY